MFRILVVSILCLVHFLMSAQTSTKFNSLVDSANKYEHTDWSLSYSYAKMALQNKGNDFSYKDIISLNVIFDTYYQKLNMLDSAFSINKQSLKLATDNKDTTHSHPITNEHPIGQWEPRIRRCDKICLALHLCLWTEKLHPLQVLLIQGFQAISH